MFVSNLTAWLIFWMLEAGLISLFRVCFQYERRSLHRSASPTLQSDPHWLAKRSDSSLYSSLEPLDSTALQFGLSLAIYKQLTFLARAELVQTQFCEHMTQQMCESELYATQIEHLGIFFVSYSRNGGLSYSIYLVLIYFYFHPNKFFYQSVTQRWLTLWWVTARNAGEQWQ